MSKNTLLKGTFILTIAGLITRIIGFFYKIYLSNMLGAEKLGVYQLIFPIYGICFTLYAVGIQTSISQMVAGELARQKPNYKLRLRSILFTGLFLSFSIALTLSFLLYNNAEFIANTILNEAECLNSLRVLAFVFPFCGVTSCINGYYYGLKKTGIPAFTQLFEQLVRVSFVFVVATYAGNGDIGVTCELAVLGVVIGEIASNLFNIFSLFFAKPKILQKNNNTTLNNDNKVLIPLLKMSLPLTSTRLIISLLHSFEAILIPSMLKKYGLSSVEALSVYGILTGMAMPFILFPSTITNSLAVLLLPTVSEAQAVNNDHKIKRTTEISIKYSLIIGLLSTAVFILFGNVLGETVFHNKAAGSFLVIMSWLCPFLYLSTTLGSIINGLGKTHLTFVNTVVGLGIRILVLVLFVPTYGITGYLIGLLISQLVIAVLDYIAVYSCAPVSIQATEWILKPSIILGLLSFILWNGYEYALVQTDLSILLLLFICCLLLCGGYFVMLILWNVVGRKDMS